MAEKLYSQIKVESQENSQVSITGAVVWAHVEKYYNKSIERSKKDLEVDGFRKGQAPDDVVIAELGQERILQDAAQTVLGDIYPEIVMENELHVIGYPNIALTKLAHGNPLEFAITSAVMPQVTLADYKKIAATHNKTDNKVEVSDQEVEDAVVHMQTMYAQTVNPEEAAANEAADKKPELPELNDEFVQKLGDFADVADFKAKLREQLTQQKEHEIKAKSRETVVMEIVEGSTFELPEILVDAELEKLLAQMKDDVSRMGLEFDKWLEHSGKTVESLREEMAGDAKQRAQAELILKEIASKESLSPDQEKVDSQTEAIKKAHPDAPDENIKVYVEALYMNEAVLSFLEEQK